MFKEVRLKLTLVNILVVGIILLLFLTGIYIFMSRELEKNVEQTMFRIAMDSRREPRFNPERPDRPRSFSDYFYIRIGRWGDVLGKSAIISISDEELSYLVREAEFSGTDRGLIKTETGDYKFLVVNHNFEGDKVYVFHDSSVEKSILSRLKFVLIFVGLCGILIVFVSSLFLADRALVPIKKAWEAQRDFAADASHELRSPLAVIQTNLEVIMNNKDETVESQMKWLENIANENKRMSKLVSELLLLARSDSGQQLVIKKPFFISKALAEVASAFKLIAEKNDMELTANITPDIEYCGDESRIKQLAVILLDNAIKYSNPGGKIKLELSNYDSKIEIIVSDNGIGIKKEDLQHIFKRFYRVDKARSREGGRTGLGLSIAEWIVKEHRGNISVSSKEGVGTTFRIILPRMQK